MPNVLIAAARPLCFTHQDTPSALAPSSAEELTEVTPTSERFPVPPPEPTGERLEQTTPEQLPAPAVPRPRRWQVEPLPPGCSWWIIENRSAQPREVAHVR